MNRLATCYFYELTYEQTAGVSEGRLGPDEPGAVGLLRRAVDEAAPDPGGAHGQHPHEQPDVATSQHHLEHRALLESGRGDSFETVFLFMYT